MLRRRGRGGRGAIAGAVRWRRVRPRVEAEGVEDGGGRGDELEGNLPLEVKRVGRRLGRRRRWRRADWVLAVGTEDLWRGARRDEGFERGSAGRGAGAGVWGMGNGFHG